MPYIIYSLFADAPIARCDGLLSELTLREGEVALPCPAGADPNDPAWVIEACNYTEHALPNAKRVGKERVDFLAAEARRRFITTGAGQEATYQLKAAEAGAYIAAERPTDTILWPLLSAEAAATGTSVSALADLVLSMRHQWIQLAAVIESARIGGKMAIEQAVDLAGVEVIVESTKLVLSTV